MGWDSNITQTCEMGWDSNITQTCEMGWDSNIKQTCEMGWDSNILHKPVKWVETVTYYTNLWNGLRQ